MQIIGNFILLFLIALVIYSCTGGKYGTDKIFGPPDDLPLGRYEDMTVDVYFYYPNESTLNLGETRGTESCGTMAYNFAYDEGLANNDEWSYACCTHEGGSSCYRKIR